MHAEMRPISTKIGYSTPVKVAVRGLDLPAEILGKVKLCDELGIPCHIARGVGMTARSIGLVGHILEEMTNPIGVEIWARADRESLANNEGAQ
ncbi:hypothetical protein [Cupriavidus basilensis]|uniref:hypothetical protein n=1 Tax=Cupriavidus basilensis TaxID=68895 RepID=UPI0023E8021E|nr:hypothetical protein [Cupriavidus basilensis]MDF3883009.1 hypothetical protein [Cupriavidus basilensis]